MICIDGDELVPEEGKDAEYDTIVAEISTLEKELDKGLKKLQKEVGYASRITRLRQTHSAFVVQLRFDILA